MIIGIGVDLVDIRRIEGLVDRFGTKFIQRVFTHPECLYAASSPHPMRAFANRFAAKEAAAKALGTGMRDGIGWQDVEVNRASSGAPSLTFHNKAYERLLALVPQGHKGCIHVSFSDEPPYSTAFVVLSAVVTP
jgi:holo-[acyl-carrier protein] synthase